MQASPATDAMATTIATAVRALDLVWMFPGHPAVMSRRMCAYAQSGPGSRRWRSAASGPSSGKPTAGTGVSLRFLPGHVGSVAVSFDVEPGDVVAELLGNQSFRRFDGEVAGAAVWCCMSNSVMTPRVVMWPIRLPCSSLNQISWCGPSAMAVWKLSGWGSGISVILPCGVIRPTRVAVGLDEPQVAVRPDDDCVGGASRVGQWELGDHALGSHSADGVACEFGEPQVAVGAGGDAGRRDAGRGSVNSSVTAPS